MPTSQTNTETQRRREGPDAIKLLKDDHREVEGWFEDFEKTNSGSKKQRLAKQICLALTVHTQIEEQIFYPAVREAIADQDIMDEADVEHDGAKNLIEQIQAMDADESHFDAKVKVLGEMIDHHVTEEREKMLPQARKSGLDLKAMVPQLEERKAQVKQELSEGVAAS